MLGTEEQTPGTITTAKADTPVVPNPAHNEETTEEDRQKLKEMLDALKTAPTISATSIVAANQTRYLIQSAPSQEENGALAKSNYSQYIIVDDVADDGQEYASVSPELKGNERDILDNGLRVISIETAYQALEANYNTRIQGFKHYQPNAAYTGNKVIILHVKQKNHGQYAKAGAQAIPGASNTIG